MEFHLEAAVAEVVQEHEGSNSNSLETCDPLYIKDNWTDSNSTEEKTRKPEREKKRKRNPFNIHDHITILRGEPPLYQCNVCMKKFKTKAHIRYHEFCQNGEKPFKCEQCGQGFIAKSHYEYHLRTHTGERPFVCPKCGKGFNQRGKLTRHMRSHTGEKPFICQQCGRGFANAQALRSHFLIHTGERPFACQYCDKRFTGKTNLKKHIITHTGETPFSCAQCGKSFGLKWTLDLHLRTHSTERPFACDQCTRAFSNSKDLRRHIMIHSEERPFKCWICGAAFRRKDNLDRHIQKTHDQPKEVAKQLANEAAAEYRALTKENEANMAKESTSKRTAGKRSCNSKTSCNQLNTSFKDGELASTQDTSEKSPDDCVERSPQSNDFNHVEKEVAEVRKENILLNYSSVDDDDVDLIGDTELEDLDDDDSQSEGSLSNFPSNISSSTPANSSGDKSFGVVLQRHEKEQPIHRKPDAANSNTNVPVLENFQDKLELREIAKDYFKITDEGVNKSYFERLIKVENEVENFNSTHEEEEIFSCKSSEGEIKEEIDEPVNGSFFGRIL